MTVRVGSVVKIPCGICGSMNNNQQMQCLTLGGLTSYELGEFEKGTSESERWRFQEVADGLRIAFCNSHLSFAAWMLVGRECV